MADTMIQDVAALVPFHSQLKALGFKTTKQVAGALSASGDALTAYLKTNRQTFGGFVGQDVISALQGVAAVRFSTGVRLDRIPVMPQAFSISGNSATPLPGKVNLVSEMQPVRDQGSRGTCVAHAATAATEHYWRGQGKVVDLSRQFLYWDCKLHDGDTNGEGTWVGIAMARLKADGCCPEAQWPYVSTAIPGNESQAPAPALAVAAAAPFRIPGFRHLPPTSVFDIKAELAARKCVAFSIPVFDSWYRSNEVARTGEITNPIPGETRTGGHAMCFVGYEDLPNDPELGGGKFYIRNSWNGNWAIQSVLNQPGYGTIPYSYIARFGAEAYSVG